MGRAAWEQAVDGQRSDASIVQRAMKMFRENPNCLVCGAKAQHYREGRSLVFAYCDTHRHLLDGGRAATRRLLKELDDLEARYREQDAAAERRKRAATGR